MDTMEKRTLAFFGQEDRYETLSSLVEYLLLTEDKDRQDAILNVIQRLTMFRDDETYGDYDYWWTNLWNNSYTYCNSLYLRCIQQGKEYG